MGCFSIACGATSVAMANDEVALIALVPVKDGIEHSMKGAALISNDGAYALYKPVLLPIFGMLDDYGTLEVITKDENTLVIERLLGADISDIAEAIARGTYADNKDIHVKLKAHFGVEVFGMFVHRKAWDLMSTTSLDSYTGKSDYSLWDHALCYPALVLTDMGFVLQATAWPDARYSQWYKHPEYPFFDIAHDGRFGKIIVAGRETPAGYSMKGWAAALKKVRTGPAFAFPSEWEKYAKETPVAATWAMDIAAGRDSARVFRILADTYSEHLHRDNEILRGELFKTLTALLCFGSYMGNVNRLLMPTFCGTQYGNNCATRAVNNLTRALLNRD